MRVIVVTPSYYPILGGSESLTSTLALKLNEAGIHTGVMTLNMNEKWKPIWRKEIEENGIFKIFKVPAVNPFNALPVNPFNSLMRVNVAPNPRFTKEFEEYDIIHFLGEADISLPLFSYLVKKPKIMHCVATYLLLQYYRKHTSLRRLFKHVFSRLADLYIVDQEEEHLNMHQLGVRPDKIVTLPVGVDVETFQPDETKKLDNLILFVGRIERIKGLHILIEALSHLELPTKTAIIGPKWEADYVKKVEAMYDKINENGVHSVKQLGSMDQRSLVKWYQKATVVVCPYLIEPYSSIVREALACGTPVVSTGTHLTDHGSDGILVTPKDPKKIAEAIRILLEDKKLNKRYGREGRETVEKYLSYQSIVKRLVEIYEKMLVCK